MKVNSRIGRNRIIIKMQKISFINSNCLRKKQVKTYSKILIWMYTVRILIAKFSRNSSLKRLKGIKSLGK